MNHKCKKLKTVERILKPRKSDIIVRPQWSRHPVPRRRKEIKKPPRVSPPMEVDATVEVLFGSAIAGPVGALMGLGSTTLRAFAYMGTETVKTIRDTAEKTRKLEKEKPAGRTG